MLSLSMDGSHAGTSSCSSATNLSKRRKIIQSLRGTKVRITVGKKSMRKFITGIKCRMQRAVNKSLGHKVNMVGKKTLGWVLPKGIKSHLHTGGVRKGEGGHLHIRGGCSAKKVKIICGFGLVSQSQCPRCKTQRSKCSHKNQ